MSAPLPLPEPQNELPTVTKLRLLPVVCTSIMALAFVGYIVGLMQQPTADDPGDSWQASKLEPAAGVVPAVTYLEQPRLTISPNLNWEQRVDLTGSRPRSEPGTVAPSLAQKRAALEARASRRAYDGAPPVIPHPVDSIDASSCLSCHEHGLAIGSVLAPAIPHAAYASCTQCHAPPAADFLRSVPLPASTFVGRSAPVAGPRASAVAPPVIPHATHMRENCLACHGPSGHAALRSTHPERQSCTQCHAPSAEYNQVLVGAGFPGQEDL